MLVFMNADFGKIWKKDTEKYHFRIYLNSIICIINALFM